MLGRFAIFGCSVGLQFSIARSVCNPSIVGPTRKYPSTRTLIHFPRARAKSGLSGCTPPRAHRIPVHKSDLSGSYPTRLQQGKNSGSISVVLRMTALRNENQEHQDPNPRGNDPPHCLCSARTPEGTAPTPRPPICTSRSAATIIAPAMAVKTIAGSS